MSFAHEIKKELCCDNDIKACCYKAELYGLLLFAGVFSAKEIKLASDKLAVVKRLAKLAYKVCGAEFEVAKNNSGFIALAQTTEAQKCFGLMGHSSKSLYLSINYSNLENDCCAAAFLKGIFLAAGSVSNPSNDYYLEIKTPHIQLAKQLEELLQLHELNPKSKVKNGVNILYFKNSIEIEDFLTIIGAAKHAFEIMNVKILKDIKNRQNRLNNFELANLSKTVSAAAKQCQAIEKIKASGLMNSLPKELRQTALARLNNPELSLSQIRFLLDPVPTRSGLNHRFAKLIEISKEL